MLIDETYFVRDKHISNVNELNSQSRKEIKGYISKYARLFLRNTLSSVLFGELESHVVNNELGEYAPEKWQHLVKGHVYTVNGVEYTWTGLIEEELFKDSIIADFVYHHWYKDNVSFASGVGEVVLKAKNATNVSCTQEYVNSWNRFVLKYQGETQSTGYRTIVKGVEFVDYFNSCDRNVSLVDYLKHQRDNFPTAQPVLYKFKNQFGL